MTLTLAAVFIMNDDLAGTGDHHQLLLAIGHIAHRCVETDLAAGLGFDARSNRCTRSRTTDVEGAHRQLRAGLADGLGGDDTDGFAGIDQAATTQVAAVALGAQAKAGGTGQRGADLDFIDAGGFEFVKQIFVEKHAGLDDHRAVFRVHHIFDHGAAEYTVAQGFDGFAALHNGAHQ